MRAFSKIHPIALLVYFLSIFLIGMFVNNPVINIITLLSGILSSSMLTNSKKKLSDFFFYISMLLLISITNPLFSHNGKTPLFFMNGNAITKEAIVCGFFIGIMIVGIMLWFKCLNLVFTSDKIVFLFGKIIPKISLVITVSLRYIPMLKRQAGNIKKSQKAMGLYSSDSYADKIRSHMRIFSSLIGWSMEQAVETSREMKARGYGLKGHSNYSNYKFKSSDVFILLVTLVLTFFVIFGASGGKLNFSYYPEITKINTSISALCSYLCYGFLTFMLFFIEVEEIIRWNYCRSKI